MVCSLKTARWMTVLALIAVGLMLNGCRSSKPDSSFVAPFAVTDCPPLTVSEGDLLVITSLYRNASVTLGEERVREDGNIVLPLIGSMRAAGKTCSELSREINESFRGGSQKVAVRVSIKCEIFYVGGQVKQPGRFECTNSIPLSRAIQTAGGFTDYANKKKVKLVRADGRREFVNCKKTDGNDPLIYPGDLIVVPRFFY